MGVSVEKAFAVVAYRADGVAGDGGAGEILAEIGQIQRGLGILFGKIESDGLFFILDGVFRIRAYGGKTGECQCRHREYCQQSGQ